MTALFDRTVLPRSSPICDAWLLHGRSTSWPAARLQSSPAPARASAKRAPARCSPPAGTPSSSAAARTCSTRRSPTRGSPPRTAPGRLRSPATSPSRQRSMRSLPTVDKAFGRVDLLFNNAGMGFKVGDHRRDAGRGLDRGRRRQPDRVLPCARGRPSRAMRRQKPMGGRIINNGSISAHAPRPGSVPYTATKHAITGLTKTLALDGRPYDIACGQIDIGNALTDMAAAMTMGVPQANLTIGHRAGRWTCSAWPRRCLHGRPAARRQRAVHDRDGDQDALRRAGIGQNLRIRSPRWPGRARSGRRLKSSAAIFSRSSASSSKSKTSKLAAMRSLVRRFRDDDQPLLEVPADDRLRDRLAVLLGDRAERRVVEQPAAAERAPALDGDAVAGVELALVALLEARMQLDLVDHRRHAGLADDALEVVLVEVRDADRADAARLPELDQRLPRLDIVVLARAPASGSGTGRAVRARASSSSRRTRAAPCRAGGAPLRSLEVMNSSSLGTPALRIASPTPSSF